MKKWLFSALPEVDPALRGAERLLIATDFDGTLCALVESAANVQLAPAMREILQQIAGTDRITLAVLSGRALGDITRRLPVPAIFAGNHGLEIEGQGLRFEHAEARRRRPVLAAACAELRGVAPAWPGAWVEDKDLSATLHYRKVDPRSRRALLFAARKALGRFGRSLAMRVGSLALEIRPHVEWDKGRAVQFIREEAGPYDACVCIGDDRTDETMFRAGGGDQVSVKVGGAGATSASYYVWDPAEVALLLAHVLAVREAPGLPATAAGAAARGV